MDGFGSMLAFEVDGGAEAAQAVAERVRVLVHATSLGGVESLIERRSRYADEAAPGGAAARQRGDRGRRGSVGGPGAERAERRELRSRRTEAGHDGPEPTNV